MPVSRRHHRAPGRFSRRRLITTATAVPVVWLAGGCTLSGPGAAPQSRPSTDAGADTDPDVVVLAQAAAEVEAVAALCERVVDERPDLAGQVRPLLRTHRRHAEVLGAASTDPRGIPSSTPGATAPPGNLPRGRAAVLSLLAATEQRAATAHLEHVRDAQFGRFAQLLASISAAESQLSRTLEDAVR